MRYNSSSLNKIMNKKEDIETLLLDKRDNIKNTEAIKQPLKFN